MDPIVQANITRFEMLLETETDPVKRMMIIRLLAEEKHKHAQKTGARET